MYETNPITNVIFMDNLLKNGIFIVHALKGYERHEKRIRELFDKKQMNFEFVTDGDPSFFTPLLIEKYFTENIQNTLSQGVLSCTLNHILAYERVAQRGLQYALIFENDPFFLGNFTQRLKRLFPEIMKTPPGFIISLENSTMRFPSYWQTKRSKHLYRARIGRMAGAYLIDRQGVLNILKDLQHNKCGKVIDWWHNSLIERDIIKMYWAHPPLVEQGSHNGLLSSTISSQSANVGRRLAWLSQKYYKYYVRRLFNEKNIIED